MPYTVTFKLDLLLIVTDQWRENQIFRQTKQGPSELSTDFIRRVEAEGVRIKATAADVSDTILQGLLPPILHSVVHQELGDSLADIRKWVKMAERYTTSALYGEKDISEIKSTINDLATRLDRTQLRAVTPECSLQNVKQSNSPNLRLQKHIQGRRHQLRL